MTILIEEWGARFFPHLTPVYQRLAVMVLLDSMFNGKEK
jgi:hypothetical protein